MLETAPIANSRAREVLGLLGFLVLATAQVSNMILARGVAGSVPPFSIAHGDADCIVPVEQSQLLADALTDAGVPVALTIEPGWIHVDARFDAELMAPTIAWLREVLGA